MITLQKDIFDTLDLVALVYGGVGAAADYDYGTENKPCCIHGLAAEAEGVPWPLPSEVETALVTAGIGRKKNDEAVRAINARKGANPHARVDFITEYCPELGIVRGE